MNRLDQKRISDGLGPWIDVRVFEEIDSTSTEARRMAGKGLDRAALILSEAQTAGRGRMGHTFYSPKYSGIYMTLIYPADGFQEDLFRVTAKAAVALVEGLREELPEADLKIKWVNDVFLNDRKVAGILTENVGRWLFIGIGINVTTEAFPEELTETAGSLAAARDRNAIVIAVVKRLIAELKRPKDRAYLATYRAVSNVIGETVLYGAYGADGKMKEGIAAGIDDDGRLIVKTADGSTEALNAGEIHIKRMRKEGAT